MSDPLDAVPELKTLIKSMTVLSKALIQVVEQRDELLDACRQVLAGRRDKDEDEEMNGWRAMDAAIARAGGK